jgi:exodeoxyribonuclease V gamma subunit
VIVMVPDVAPTAPHIQAVFGLLAADDPRHLPYTLADQGQRHTTRCWARSRSCSALPQSRIAVSDRARLARGAALRARFGIAESQLPLLHRWIVAANIRWGLHAEHRAALDLPAAWRRTAGTSACAHAAGLCRGRRRAWDGVEPLDEIGGLDAALLGPLVRLLDALEAHWRLLATPAAPARGASACAACCMTSSQPTTAATRLHAAAAASSAAGVAGRLRRRRAGAAVAAVGGARTLAARRSTSRRSTATSSPAP